MPLPPPSSSPQLKATRRPFVICIFQGGFASQRVQVAAVRGVLLHRHVRHVRSPGPCPSPVSLWHHQYDPVNAHLPSPVPPLPLPSAAVEPPGRPARAANHRDRAHHAGRRGDQLHQCPALPKSASAGAAGCPHLGVADGRHCWRPQLLDRGLPDPLDQHVFHGHQVLSTEWDYLPVPVPAGVFFS
jgi:hypothetical protein